MLFGQFLSTNREVWSLFREFGAGQYGMKIVVDEDLEKSYIYTSK